MHRTRPESSPRSRPWGTPLLLAAPLLAAVACSGSGTASSDTAAAPPIAVEAVPARSGTLPLVERLSGIARAANQVELRPEIPGIVQEVRVASGAAVRKGQALVRLRDTSQREQLEGAEAALQVAEASAEEARARTRELRAQVVRSRALAEEDLVSPVERETLEAQLAAAEASAAQAVARVAQARATVEERRADLDRTVVRAPMDGRVGRRNVEVGMRVGPESLLFVLGDPTRLIVEVPITEAMLSYLQEGQPVELIGPSSATGPVRGTLARIPPFLAPGSFSTVGEIDIDNTDGKLQPGMFLAVDVRYGETRTATLVPTSSLWEDPGTGTWSLFIVRIDATVAESRELSEETHPVERRPVIVIAEGRTAAGVSGVNEGEWVVTVGQHLLARAGDGAMARVRPTTWEQVVELQRLQREDLLERFLDKQQRLARELGAEPPPNEDYVGDASGR